VRYSVVHRKLVPHRRASGSVHAPGRRLDADRVRHAARPGRGDSSAGRTTCRSRGRRSTMSACTSGWRRRGIAASPWLSTLRHIAKEGRVYVIGCLQRDADRRSPGPASPSRASVSVSADGWINPGDSVIVDPDGKVLAGAAATSGRRFLLAEVDPQTRHRSALAARRRRTLLASRRAGARAARACPSRRVSVARPALPSTGLRPPQA
jgi:hypothetical protein